MISGAITLAEKNFFPDWLIRLGIRKLMKEKLSELSSIYVSDGYERKKDWVDSMNKSPLAFSPKKANEQHYEVPSKFFQQVSGPRMKYSSCFWDSSTTNLYDAENQMLDITIRRSGIEDGMRVLDLGCGWGSLSIYIAEKLSQCNVVSVSNSQDQGNYILKEVQKKGLTNLSFIKADMNTLHTDITFDRIISVEMFEHMRNYRLLLNKIAGWLKKNGKLFIHIFCHNDYAYPYETNTDSDWMTRYYFTGGMMPSYDLLEYFQDDLDLEKSWKINGNHYRKTCRAWLNTQDKRREKIMEIFQQFYGDEGELWFNRWRIFWMACEELFAYNEGEEWFIGHFLMEKKGVS